MTLALIGAFVGFMALIGAVHAVDTWSLRRYGYAPFALVNVLAMLLPSGGLLAGIALLLGPGAGGHGSAASDLDSTGLLALAQAVGPHWLWVLGIGAGAAMAWLIGRRTNAWVALFAAPLLLTAAPVLVFSVLFRAVAGTGHGGD